MTKADEIKKIAGDMREEGRLDEAAAARAEADVLALKGRRFFGAVQNYAANVLGLDRNAFVTEFHKRVDAWLESYMKHHMDHGWLGKMVRDRVEAHVRAHVNAIVTETVRSMLSKNPTTVTITYGGAQ
jgi:hypothetical protein